MKMTQLEITQYARKFLKEQYGMELEIPIEVNGRLSSTLGVFKHTVNTKKSVKMEISKKFLIHGKLEEIQSTIRHECCHYYCFESGLNYRDGDDDFENELRKTGTGSTRTTKLLLQRNVAVYKCECTEHIRKRQLSNQGRNHRCGSCKVNLIYMGKRTVKM